MYGDDTVGVFRGFWITEDVREFFGLYPFDVPLELGYVEFRVGAIVSQGSGRRAILMEQIEELTF